MLDIAIVVLFAILIALVLLFATWGVLLALSAFAGIEILNVLLSRLGLSRPSPEGHTTGQRHTARVSSAFQHNPARGCAEGTVQLHGEIWNADCREPLAAELAPGATVVVVYGDRLRVRVERRANAADGA